MRRDGLKWVGGLDSRPRGSSLGWGHRSVLMGTQVFKWVAVNLMSGVALRRTSISPKGEGVGSHFTSTDTEAVRRPEM